MQFKRNLEKHLLPSLVMLVLSGAGLGLLSLYFSTGQYGLPLVLFYLTQPLTVALNLLPFILFNFLFFFLTNRLWSAFALDSVLCLMFSWANYWKLLARDAPIIASDLLIVSEALEMSGRYISFTPRIIGSIFLVAIAAGLLAAFFKGCIKSRKVRCLCFVAVLLIIILLACTVYVAYNIYLMQENWPELTEWFTTTWHISRGGIYPFLYSIPQAFPTPPEGYREDQTKDMIAAYQEDAIPEDQKASVIFVMLEAFADFSDDTDAITTADPYELYHKLQEESYCGTLLTNVFAGGTNHTEQCVITGFPYLDLFTVPSWSYARYFESQGYLVNGAHAGFQGFYSRNTVNANLGFPEYRFIDNYYNGLPEGTLRSWELLDKDTAYYLSNLYADEIPMDFQFLPEVTDYCKQQIESGSPVFSFNITYQNHGPYPGDKLLYPKEYVPQGGMSSTDYHIVNNYLAGLENTAMHIGHMLDAFRDYDEPVVLVFFGDHKPWLGDQNSTYTALGIDLSSGSDDSFYNYYATDYMIWANDAAKKTLNNSFVGTGPTISPSFLMNVVFEQCGWAGPAYQKIAGQVMASVPVIHTTGVYLTEDQLVSGDALSDEQRSLLHRLNCVRYYYSNKYMLQ